MYFWFKSLVGIDTRLMAYPTDFIHLLETKQEVSAYFEEVLRFKPILLVFVRIHKVPYMSMCWQKIRAVVWEKRLTDRRLLNIINDSLIIDSNIGYTRLDHDFVLYDKKPEIFVGETALRKYMTESNKIEKYGIRS